MVLAWLAEYRSGNCGPFLGPPTTVLLVFLEATRTVVFDPIGQMARPNVYWVGFVALWKLLFRAIFLWYSTGVVVLLYYGNYFSR